jgi:hypothetical protein
MPTVCSFVDPNLLDKSVKVDELGSGTFGSVSLYDTPLGRYVVKETKKTDESAGYPRDFVTEVDSLFKFRAISTIVRIDGVCFDSKQRRGFLLLEPMETNLRRWYGTVGFRERIEALPTVIQHIGGALAIMHSMGFVHNDMKNNNILTNNGELFKLADFGKCLYVTNVMTRYGGINRYCPFVVRDIFIEELYAFCVVLTELIIGKNMIHIRDDRDEERTIKSFYSRYGSGDKRVVFDIEKFLRDELSSEEYKQVPKIYWNYVKAVFGGDDYITSTKALRKIELDISKSTLDTVRETISFQNRLHPKLDLVKDRAHRLIQKRNYKKASRILGLFDRLMSRFLYTKEGAKLNEKSIEFYAEVALIILLNKKYLKSEYFSDEEQLLLFQRSFMAAVEYQTIVLPEIP